MSTYTDLRRQSVAEHAATIQRRAHGGGMADEADDKKLIRAEMKKMKRADGGAVADGAKAKVRADRRAKGGKAGGKKHGTTVNIIMPQDKMPGGAPPAMPPHPMMPPHPPMAGPPGMPPGGPPGMPPGGPPMGGPPGMPPRPGMPPGGPPGMPPMGGGAMPMRAKGGGMTGMRAGAMSGVGRLEKRSKGKTGYDVEC